MRVHHLNCGTDCPFGGRLMDGRSGGLLAKLVCHCLLIETEAGLVLVDTGYGLKDVRQPYPRLSRAFKAMLNIQLREEDTAIRQLQRLGFSAADVRHIVLTHLDFDHAGGLEDFPNAVIHVIDAELAAAGGRAGGSWRVTATGPCSSTRCAPGAATWRPAGAGWASTRCASSTACRRKS